MPAARQDLIIEQGATWLYTIDVSGLDLAGATGDLQVRSTPGSSTILLEVSTANGRMTITPTGATTATILLTATPAETRALTPRADAYDLELTLATGEVVRVLYGTVTVTGEVTR